MSNLPQDQQEDCDQSAFKEDTNDAFNLKQVSDQIILKHDALQAIAVAKAKEVLAETEESNEEVKREDSKPINRCNQSSAELMNQNLEPVRKAKTVVPSKKRDDKYESKSLASRTTNGRFEAKYKIGEKTASGAIIKDVKEEDWMFIERDSNGNSYFKCLKCTKASRVRKGNRKTHSC